MRSLLNQSLENTWMEPHIGEIFQICDELIKNAVKSNYKFILLWQACLQKLQELHPSFTEEEANDWLSEIFYSGEDKLVAKQLEKVENREEISRNVRQLLDAESRSLKRKRRAADAEPRVGPAKLDEKFLGLLQIRKLSRKLKIYVHFRVDKSTDQIFITAENDSPILEEDFARINQVRYKFKTYYTAGNHEQFFIDNLDTSGGGHGLGYAIMDSIILGMNLDPEICLYLISASRTMVLLVLPVEHPTVPPEPDS